MNGTKLCPYCAEEVRAQAVKCRYCGSRLDGGRFIGDWYRTANDRMLAGVCGGLALQFGVPAAVVRLAFVLMTLFAGGIGLVIYAVLWVVMPLDRWLEE
jgi:phage shock protein PspC (stress-responsive transcriptional regulator)